MINVPTPLKEEKGWPWTPVADSHPLETGLNLPRFSVLMPSYNQRSFIEQAIRSVLCQNYPYTELIVIDGGSTDGTLEVIKHYDPWISYWISEKDKGMAEALNKGFRKATGDLIGWQNTDDYYGPGSFLACARAVTASPEAAIFHGRTWFVDGEGNVIGEIPSGEFRLKERAEAFPLLGLPNQSAFMLRTALGGGHFVDESYKCGMDTELFSRLILAGHKTLYVEGIEGYYRVHAEAKTFVEGSTSAIEACRLCEETLCRIDLDHELRERITAGYRKRLIDLFRTGDTANFRRFAWRYLSRPEGKKVDFDLLGRMILSLSGSVPMKTIMRRLHGLPAQRQLKKKGS